MEKNVTENRVDYCQTNSSFIFLKPDHWWTTKTKVSKKPSVRYPSTHFHSLACPLTTPWLALVSHWDCHRERPQWRTHTAQPKSQQSGRTVRRFVKASHWQRGRVAAWLGRAWDSARARGWAVKNIRRQDRGRVVDQREAAQKDTGQNRRRW